MAFDPRLRITPAVADKLHKLGLYNNWDLILHLPLRYEDQTHITAIADCRHGDTVQVEGEIIDQQLQYRPRRQLVCRLQDASGELTLRYLNFYPSQMKQLAIGQRLRVYGEVRQGFFGAEMVHPKARSVAAAQALPESLSPVYPTTAGLAQNVIASLTQRALGFTPLQDTLPETLRDALRLWPLADSLSYLHAPPPDALLQALDEHDHPAWQRLQFDELLAQQLSLRRAYAARRLQTAPRLLGNGQLCQRFLDNLPFRLTGAQQRVVNDISRDITLGYPMHRLLQGDVGSGKTVVAALAALQAIEAGYQAAFMAPTELLAEQHFQKLSTWLQALGLEVVWLSGSQKKKQRIAGMQRVAEGLAPLVVGTHALFQDQVNFHRLGLAIVDEQHRFGVTQRLALRQKGEQPHQLMMSATPIPRTLSMSYFADLEVSTIDELPPGRTPILTRMLSTQRRADVIERLRHYCGSGQQAYWVCPLIEESEALDLQSAIDTHAQLQTELTELRIGLLHGRLPPAEKAAIMAAFASHELDVLVATTVIEVGVDVPNASLMVIEHAERFGLAQLHQLRGRVGRGAKESICLLVYATPLSELARARLKIIHDCSDGFEIARQDLLLRGPGEFLGTRQSGAPLLRFANPEQQETLLEQAQQTAQELLTSAPAIADAHLARWHGGRAELLKA